MKYKYLYQSSENKNLEGWIKAPDRAGAYAALRKRGIRPYRLVGDDPPAWRRPPVLFAAAFCAAAAALSAAVVAAKPDGGPAPERRQQLPPDSPVVEKGLETCWEGVFSTALDRYLAAYAQPGWIAIPPETSPEDVAGFGEDLSKPQEFPDSDPPETRLLRLIVAGMRKELSGFLEDGGSVAEYLAFLDERQDEERETRARAEKAIASASPAERQRLRASANIRLKEMGLAEIPSAGDGETGLQETRRETR